MTTKKIERLGTEKLSGEVSTTSNNALLRELNKMAHKMIYVINKRKEIKSEDIIYFDNIGHLAQSHLISPIFYLCELARFLNEEEWAFIFSFWLEDYDFINNVIKKLEKGLNFIEVEKEIKNANRND